MNAATTNHGARLKDRDEAERALREEQALITFAVEFLTIRGFTVGKSAVKPQALIGPRDYWLQLKPPYRYTQFWYRLNHALCPPYYARRGPQGRLVQLQPNPTLEKFLRQNTTRKAPLMPVDLL